MCVSAVCGIDVVAPGSSGIVFRILYYVTAHQYFVLNFVLDGSILSIILLIIK